MSALVWVTWRAGGGWRWLRIEWRWSSRYCVYNSIFRTILKLWAANSMSEVSFMWSSYHTSSDIVIITSQRKKSDSRFLYVFVPLSDWLMGWIDARLVIDPHRSNRQRMTCPYVISLIVVSYLERTCFVRVVRACVEDEWCVGACARWWSEECRMRPRTGRNLAVARWAFFRYNLRFTYRHSSKFCDHLFGRQQH